MKRATTWFSVLPSLVIPVCLGLVLYIGMKAAIQHHWIADETVLRYLVGHWVSEISVAMFFVGLVSLLMIGLDVFQQVRVSEWIQLEGTKQQDSNVAEEAPGERAANLARRLERSDSGYQGHYLYQRLAAALKSIHQSGTASHVAEELKYLADIDADQQQQRYSLVQILIWATPMLGFLGTVLGISQALGGISVGPDNDFQKMMDGLKSSLYVAFDTTALALSLSMLLMFGQFVVDRFELQLLQMVDHRARTEISSQFDLSGAGSEALEIDLLETRLISTMETATERQTELWRESLQWAGSAVSQAIRDSQNKFETSLGATLDNSLQGLAFNLGESISRADQSMSHRWEQWQVILSENARHIAKNQTSFVEQTQAVCRMLEQTAERTDRSTQELTERLFSQTAEMNERLQTVSNDLRLQSFIAKPEEVLSTQRLSNLNFVDETFDGQKPEDQHTIEDSRVVEGQWISVSPTFLSDNESSQQVILPFPAANVTKRDSENSPVEKRAMEKAEPEIVLPFLKKSA